MAIDINKVSINVGDKLQIVGDPVIVGNKIRYTIRGVKAGLATVSASYDRGNTKSDTIMVENKPVFQSLTVDQPLPVTGEDITVTATFDKVPLLTDYNAVPTDGLTLKSSPRIVGNTIVVVYTVRDPGEQRVSVTYDGENKVITVDAELPVTLKTIETNPTDNVTVESKFTLKLKF